MYTTDEQVYKRVQEHCAHALELGYEIVAVMLQGSQNYKLSYEGSDVDTKAIVLPSLEDILLARKPASTTLVLENNEHIDIKDIRLMFENYKKQNINFVETLFTKYMIVNPKYQELFQPVLDKKHEIAHYNKRAAVKCMHGMMLEKLKALEHPYPSIKDKVEKYGYCSKQLHHIIRLEEFMRRYTVGVSYEECLIPSNPQYLIKVKQHLYSLEQAREISEQCRQKADGYYRHFMETDESPIDHSIEKLFEQTIVNILTYHLQDIFIGRLL